MNKRKVIGWVTLGVALAGTVYCLKKYKESKAFGPEVEITLTEARKLLDDRPDLSKRVEYHEIARSEDEMSAEEIDDMILEAQDEASFNASFVTQPSYPAPDLEPSVLDESSIQAIDHNAEYDYYHGLDYNVPLSATITEEEKELRYDPSSIQARDQFIKMELADLSPNSAVYQIMKRLFGFEFEALNDGDEILRSQLEDYRQEFFGPVSQWNNVVGYGDLICHYARLLDYNVGDGIGTWITRLVSHVEFVDIEPDHIYGEIIEDLNQHSYRNHRTGYYGLFRLDEFAMSDAQTIADETVDGEITYDIEYNEFLKQMI